MIQLEPHDLLMIILNGNLADSVAIPREIAKPLLGQPGIIFEDDGPAASFVTIWSPFGWDNELRRRAWFEKVKQVYKEKPLPTKKAAISIEEYV